MLDWIRLRRKKHQGLVRCDNHSSGGCNRIPSRMAFLSRFVFLFLCPITSQCFKVFACTESCIGHAMKDRQVRSCKEGKVSKSAMHHIAGQAHAIYDTIAGHRVKLLSDDSASA